MISILTSTSGVVQREADGRDRESEMTITNCMTEDKPNYLPRTFDDAYTIQHFPNLPKVIETAFSG